MALQITVPANENPHGTSDIPAAYSKNVFFAWDETSQQMRVVANLYQDSAARNGLKQPVGQHELVVQKDAQPEQLDEQGNVIHPAIPSFADLLAANQASFDAIKTSVYNLWKASHPKYQNATDV